MTDKLTPVRCGCGGEAQVRDYSRFGGAFILVECERCGTQTDLYPTEAEAIQAWNRAMGADQFREVTKKIERTAKAVTVEKPNVYKCSECGQYFHSTAWGSPVEYCSRCGARLEWE